VTWVVRGRNYAPSAVSTVAASKEDVKMHGIDYESVLADLRDRRAKLDTAIVAIEQIVLGIGQSAIAGTPTKIVTPLPGAEPIGESLPPQVESDTFFGLSASDGAKKYLKMVKRPTSLAVICRALQEGGYLTTAKNFYSNLYTTLARSDDFVQVGKNWGLVEWYPGRRMEPKGKPGNGAASAATEAYEGATRETEHSSLPSEP
jgi:hypothetical protein